MKIFIPCEEANHSCDKNQYREASFWEKVRLNIHLIYCKACRKYTARNIKLSKKMRKANLETMNLSDKELLKEKLRQQLGQ